MIESADWTGPADEGVFGSFSFERKGLEGIYGVPNSVIGSPVYVNTKLLKEHGIETPKTWEDVLAMTEKLKEAPSFDGERVIVIAESPLVFEELIKRGIKINQLNIGGMGIRGERKAVARRVACDTMEMEAIHELIKKHVHVYFQTVPTRSSEEAKKYIKE